MADSVNHPSHYKSHPSGVECITIVEHMSFLRGNAIKYLWCAGQKGDALEDLRKARWYLDREIANLESARGRLYDVETGETVEAPREYGEEAFYRMLEQTEDIDS
jgi:hypothetical protein